MLNSRINLPKIQELKKKISNPLTRYWKKEETRKLFFLNIAKEYNIEYPAEWSRIGKHEIELFGGRGMLSHHYRGSIYRALTLLFPEIKWEQKWFSHGAIWIFRENQRKFFDNIAKKYKINKPCDWGEIRSKQIIEAGGGSLLQCFGGSVYRALKSAYPDVSWNREWFHYIPKYSSSFWQSLENQRGFMDSIASQYNITKFHDWSRVSLSLVRSKGGNGLLRKYNNSLHLILSSLYPNLNWRNEAPQMNNVSGAHNVILNYTSKFWKRKINI